MRQLLPTLHQLSQGQDADGSRHRGDGLAAAGAGRRRHDAAVQTGQTVAEPSLVAPQQQRPRTCRLRRPGKILNTCIRNKILSLSGKQQTVDGGCHR